MPREHPALRRLVSTMTAPVAVLDRTGTTLLFANQPFARMLHRTREQLEAQPFTPLIPPADRRRLGHALAQVKPEPETIRDLMLRSDVGERVYVHLSLRRLQPPFPELILLTAQDLTRHYRKAELLRRQKAGLETQVQERTAELLSANEALQAANDALATQRQLLQTILDQATDGIAARDADGRLIFANAAAKRRARVPPEGTPLEAAPSIWGETYDAAGNLLPVTAWPVYAALRGETVTGMEWHRLLPDGSRYVVMNSAAPLRDAAGRINGAVSITTEITERKQAEEALAAQQRLLETILEQATEGIVVRDANGRVILANAEVRRWARLPPESTALPMAEEVWGETRDASGRRLPAEEWPIAKALRGERTMGVEFHRISQDGSPQVILNSAAPLRDADGRIIGAVAINTDITAQQRVQSALREALAEKEAALAAREALLADKETLLREVHHRVKNNLQMLCDLLYLQAEAVDDPTAENALRDASGRLYAIARLHEQLYQSMQSGRVLLGDYLSKLVRGVASVYPQLPIQLEIPEASLFLDVDRAIHTGLIVNELVTNAVKHAFPPGQPDAEVLVRLQARGETVELQIRDNGSGLPADLDLERARSLGLRIVHILSQRLRATVTIESPPGATFTIRFPLRLPD